mmetsp:Transcript_1877/g.4795  ORF Transcript_1877/g.4795 Transcript_1877/m.4795 type:complete len:124 (+) Transcript_1877:37-408(+)
MPPLLDKIGVAPNNLVVFGACLSSECAFFNDAAKCCGEASTCQCCCCHCSTTARLDFDTPLTCCLYVCQCFCCYYGFACPCGSEDVPILLNCLGINCFPKCACCQTQAELVAPKAKQIAHVHE